VKIEAPLITERLRVSISIPPAFPVENSIELIAPLEKRPSRVCPSKRIESEALIVIVPAFPCPLVAASNCAPLITERLRVSIFIPPAVPSPVNSTELDAALVVIFLLCPSKRIDS
jgi:hypothetical protein